MPNVRLRPDAETLRRATRAMTAATDIALPSFDDEAQVWRDADPHATLSASAPMAFEEIVVKNGGDDATVSLGAASHIRGATGAGASFNTGYLAGRVTGMTAFEACELGQRVTGEVISHFGALAPRETLTAFPATVHDSIESRERIGGRS